MPEICKLPTESLRAPNRHPSFYPQIAARAKRRCQTRGQEDSTQSNTMQHSTTTGNENSCAHARERQRRSLPSSRHGLRPGRNAFLELQPPNRHANRSNETDRTAISHGHHVNMIRPNHQTRRRSVTSLNACDIIVPYRDTRPEPHRMNRSHPPMRTIAAAILSLLGMAAVACGSTTPPPRPHTRPCQH